MIRIRNKMLSPTAINTYLYCPRKYFFRYIKKLRTKPSIHLIRGLIVHKTIQEFHQDQPKVFHKLPVEMVSNKLLDIFNRRWESSKEQLNKLGLPQNEIDFFHDDSERMLINFSHWFCGCAWSPADSSEEKMFSKHLKLMGIVDAIHRIGEKVAIVDYKTSKHAKVTDEILRQAALYALLYQDKYNVVPDTVFIHFLTEPGNPEPIHIDEAILEYGKILIEHIREVTATDDEKDYPCKCGGYCE